MDSELRELCRTVGIPELSGSKLALEAAVKRIATLESDNATLRDALRPYAVESGYGLDGDKPNNAWRALMKKPLAEIAQLKTVGLRTTDGKWWPVDLDK